jgi:tellurite resistance protein TehA-like permease
MMESPSGVVEPVNGERVPLQTALWRNVETLNPAYFALVMATGIVSTASHLLGMPWVALPLFWLNILAFAILVVLTAIRLLSFPRQMLADLTDHKRGVGFFTLVAASCVLGNQFLLIAELPAAATMLWCLGTIFWFVLTYTIFASFTVKQVKPSLPEGLHGGWLVSVVAAQSVAVLGGMLAGEFGPYREQALLFALAMWLGGGMLYVLIISLIFYRYTFFPMSPADLGPPYWINMGAMAISTLAGTILISVADTSAILFELLPFVKGITLLFWAAATWWIPMLVFLGIWRHIVKRFHLAYDPQYWGAVFPLGMYTACTFRLANAMDAPFLIFIPKCFIYVALGAWILTFLAMLYSLAKMLKPLLQARGGA